MPTFPIQKTKKQKQQNEQRGVNKFQKDKPKCPHGGQQHGEQQLQPSVMEILSPNTTKNPPSDQESTSLMVCYITVPIIPSLAKRHTQDLHSEFLNLPKNNKYCASVDVEFDILYQCSLCGIVYVGKDQKQSFTMGRWNEHEMSKKVIQALGEEESERIEAKK